MEEERDGGGEGRTMRRKGGERRENRRGSTEGGWFSTYTWSPILVASLPN